MLHYKVDEIVRVRQSLAGEADNTNLPIDARTLQGLTRSSNLGWITFQGLHDESGLTKLLEQSYVLAANDDSQSTTHPRILDDAGTSQRCAQHQNRNNPLHVY